MNAPVLHPGIMLAAVASSQLDLFARFLTQARQGIDSTGITAGMQSVASVVLAAGFLWQVYQSALEGGSLRGLMAALVRYVAAGVLVGNYGSVFTAVNQGSLNTAAWMGELSGTGDLLSGWQADLQTQYAQSGFESLWGLVTGSAAGILEALLVLAGYLLLPIVTVIFGFFYLLYGSVLYIFGPVMVALLPLGAARRIARSWIENLLIWNAWPVLFSGLGVLIGAVGAGQAGQMIGQSSFLGGLGNLEGAVLLGVVSIVYSLAIAAIPLLARRIITGELGSTAAAVMGAAMTAIATGAAAAEGAVTGLAASQRIMAGGGGGRGAAAGAAGPSGGLAGARRGSAPPPPASGGALRPAVRGRGGEDGRGPGAGRSGPGRQGLGRPGVGRGNVGTWAAYHAARIAAVRLAPMIENREAPSR